MPDDYSRQVSREKARFSTQWFIGQIPALLLLAFIDVFEWAVFRIQGEVLAISVAFAISALLFSATTFSQDRATGTSPDDQQKEVKQMQDMKQKWYADKDDAANMKMPGMESMRGMRWTSFSQPAVRRLMRCSSR